jgi:hypothetical protein
MRLDAVETARMNDPVRAAIQGRFACGLAPGA